MKKRTEKRKQPNKSRKDIKQTDLGNLGLEPPKIYRESQKRITNQSSNDNTRKKFTRNDGYQPTRTEQRQHQSKKRKKRNKLRKLLIWLVVIIAIAAVGVVLSLTVFFNIEEVTVKGNERYQAEEIIDECKILTGTNLFLANADVSKEAIEEKLPYVYNAQIKRKLPSTIEIIVTEATPAYSIKNKNKTYVLLDDNFKVLETKAKKSSGITIKKADIKKAKAGYKIEFKNKDVSDCLEKLAAVVKDNNFTEITSIYCNNISDNYVVYDGRIEFKLGNCDDLESKIYQGLASCKQLNESSPNVKGVMTVNGGKRIYFTEK